ncbi:MAG: hypothetical protein WBE10_11805, partial [Candidatus Acidiferrum sp.]
MRTTTKVALPLALSVAAISLLFAGYQVRTEKRNLNHDLVHRAENLGESLQETVEHLMEQNSPRSLQRFVERYGQREHLRGLAVYDEEGRALEITEGLPPELKTRPKAVSKVTDNAAGEGEFLHTGDLQLYIYELPLERDGKAAGTLGIFYDTSYIDSRLAYALRDSLLNALVQTVLITGLALLLVRWNLTGPLNLTAKWLRTLRTGSQAIPPAPPQGEIFDQLHQEVTHLAQDLNAARATAEQEARLRDTHSSLWTAERLRVSLRNKLRDKPLYVVSNREPCMHVYNEKDHSIGYLVPASGLVTALQPVLIACDGTWIAHGSGNADREVVDAHDHLRVPPDHPSYT